MKNKLLIFSLFVAFSVSAFAQEYIKDVYAEKTDTSIVREIDINNRLVYTDGYLHPAFMMYTDNSTLTTNMYLSDNIRVKDFEIKRDSVYFCGLEYTPTGKMQAIFGYFDLSSFPYSSVYYYRHIRYNSFYNLECFDVITGNASQMHVVFIASISNKQSTIVDSYKQPSNLWQFRGMLENDSTRGHVFCDLAVTSNAVVATSCYTIPSSPISDGYAWQFFKPNYIDGTIFSLLIQRLELPFMTESNPLVESCINNWFTVAAAVNNNTDIAIWAFDGINYNSSLVTTDHIPNQKTVEMKYNSRDQVMDVLVCRQPKLDPNTMTSVLYHFLPSHQYVGGTIMKHNYSRECLLSLDHLYYNPGYYVSSGYNTYDHTLSLYKYWDANVLHCPSLSEATLIVPDSPKRWREQQYPEWYKDIFSRLSMPTSVGDAPIITRCDARSNPEK